MAAKLIKEVNAAECFGLDKPFHAGLARDALRNNLYSWYEGAGYDINVGFPNDPDYTQVDFAASNRWYPVEPIPWYVPTFTLPGGTAKRKINVLIFGDTSGGGATATVRVYLTSFPSDLTEPDGLQTASLDMGAFAAFGEDDVDDAGGGSLSFSITPNFRAAGKQYLRIIASCDDNGETLRLYSPTRVWEDREPF